MSPEHRKLAGSITELKRAAADFAAFSTAERERRISADPDFDPELFDEAVQLIIRKLDALQAEGF